MRRARPRASTGRVVLRPTLRQRDFALVGAGQLVSRLGNVMVLIALPFFVYRTTGSVLATGGTFLAASVPAVLVGPVAGVAADRFPARQVMIVADLARAVGVLGLVAVAGGHR